ncbi:ComEA family DNA-binding protein [Candidatus Thiothrix anitrata]|jgi:competence protein ComEA|uniref:Helix-hairpin-helix domain-containing protein n=1 Tax=Candidatus Thiothrix anitrata TaxID=2823902 RepID=A0ABX7WZJ6_9GAMM|nr:helix-hairpin-helix domain-containing protein [Candidatus Thiothrix anitrata]QTR49040.1 helix-hairpin-helix domain-containing protein [Candidatus Thiothrix anitrata]
MKKTLIAATLLACLSCAPAVFAEMININKADAATLDSLDGIGAAKAEAIVAYRTEHGDFKTLDEIKEVKGIGDKLFEKIKADISLTEGATTASTTATDKSTGKADAKTADKTDAKPSDKTDKVSEKSASKTDSNS